ncbi:hypothetical protein MIZ03_1383 [Rhodoferax lithotrophicus]|uniref:Uncharacterized protein n=1 Tax=Rhodoferax lithotrophicus TaxID=2798804 RepID=A0ABN6D3C7_9BURK|nr:hypothetical protein MIZ03_1383 [Rhodoferax sp. MIZ03]
MLAKKFMDFLQRRRVYGQWQHPKKFDRNLVVMGALPQVG